MRSLKTIFFVIATGKMVSLFMLSLVDAVTRPSPFRSYFCLLVSKLKSGQQYDDKSSVKQNEKS